MAELRVTDIDDKVMAQIKAKAALAGKTLGEYIREMLRRAAR